MTLTYAVVTPARNEADNLRRLARCLAAQTVVPNRWIVVDNGSTDETAAVIEEVAREHPWARALSVEGAPFAQRGGPVVRALRAGVEALGEPVDVIIKVDADVSMEPNHIERLLEEFVADPRLGIASGSLLERDSGVWRQRFSTRDMGWGAFRAYRAAFVAVLFPLPERQGWDEIDAIKASLHGFRTRTIYDLPFWHHRVEGKRDGGGFVAWRDQGDVAYYLRYRPLYLVLRAAYRTRRDPVAAAMLWGYARAALRREPRLDDVEVVAYLRQCQRIRALPRAAREALGLSKRHPEEQRPLLSSQPHAD
jgi:biofilm PGA synthesis N-glycosyltransferase PgaC